ncbi:MAG: LCP family protein [Erysipelotrichaceae bacterium]|nr:LCP family protein [Erysipelotrichaceae bacterium]
MKKVKKLLLVLLCLILLGCAGGFGYVHSKFSLMKDDNASLLDEHLGQDYETVVGADEDQILQMEQATSSLDEKEAVLATKDIVEDKHVLNILLIGTDERTGSYSENARGDTCLLLSINTTQDVPVLSLVSFERGMGVPILEGEYQGQYDWLTHTFRYGGAELLLKEVRECFKIDVDYYVRVNFNAFEKGIDAIGGVDVHLDEKEVQYFIDGYKHKEAKVGMNHLNGKMALNYARLREIDSDWVRIQRQREVIFSALSQVTNMSLLEINELADTVLPLVKTNLTELKVAEMLLLVPELSQLQTQQMTIPAKGTYGSMTGMGGRRLFAVDFETNSQILYEFLYEPQINQE